jgi:hypothetical protein
MMGSELRLRGHRSNRVPRDDVVWGERLSDVWSTLARHPELLASQELVATNVLHTMQFAKIETRAVYGPLLDFCTSSPGLGLTNNVSFHAFPYDWRLDLTETAAHLAAFVDRLPTPVFIVAHSIGGSVTRIMMNSNVHVASRVRGIFQIASPIGGSSKAFITLKRRPSLGPISDALWRLFHLLCPNKRAQLMNALGNMPSLYQLLPPLEEKILLQSGGTVCSALDEKLWAPRDRCMLDAAMSAHKSLTAIPEVPIKCVYSTHIATEWLLVIDDNSNLVATGRKAEGDGTVTSASASAKSSDIVAFGGSSAEHTRLCSRKDLHEALRAFLS